MGDLDPALVEKAVEALTAERCTEPDCDLTDDRCPYVDHWPADERDLYRNGDWKSFEERAGALDELRRGKRARAVLDAVVPAVREAERDVWVERLAALCDDDWLRQRDRAMDLHGTKTHGWVRRGSSAWEAAANQVRAVLNELADYEERWCNTHAAYMRWMTGGRDLGEQQREEQG
ncbi:hypothetical protein G5V59_02630 [Nocardioides sp. W3-2-3]|uniref:hypothetical protein n=1 Tax=Nocardioides convexus TaxID=2712224 RepID=UPI0024189F79|nr:hypothetical protein [Nocardioides convexus]NGZ99648.1 hypothetical protein [Nocardioides convexus]